MINIQYTSTPQETAAVSLQFLANRPAVASMFSMMKIICISLFVAFAYSAYHQAIHLQDVFAVIAALMWLKYYKNINIFIIKNMLKRKQAPELSYDISINESSIAYKQNNNHPTNISWKKLKFVLRDASGYIIPLTGFANAGRFIWVPQRCLRDSEPAFLELLHKAKLKIKTIK